MNRVQQYFERAAQAQRAAEAATDPTIKENFLKAAKNYAWMAEQIKRTQNTA